MNPETRFELEPMTEPETNPEWSTPIADTADWDSLKDVPFAGDCLDKPAADSEIPEVDTSGILDKQ